MEYNTDASRAYNIVGDIRSLYSLGTEDLFNNIMVLPSIEDLHYVDERLEVIVGNGVIAFNDSKCNNGVLEMLFVTNDFIAYHHCKELCLHPHYINSKIKEHGIAIVFSTLFIGMTLRSLHVINEGCSFYYQDSVTTEDIMYQLYKTIGVNDITSLCHSWFNMKKDKRYTSSYSIIEEALWKQLGSIPKRSELYQFDIYQENVCELSKMLDDSLSMNDVNTTNTSTKNISKNDTINESIMDLYNQGVTIISQTSIKGDIMKGDFSLHPSLMLYEEYLINELEFINDDICYSELRYHDDYLDLMSRVSVIEGFTDQGKRVTTEIYTYWLCTFIADIYRLLNSDEDNIFTKLYYTYPHNRRSIDIVSFSDCIIQSIFMGSNLMIIHTSDNRIIINFNNYSKTCSYSVRDIN